MVGQVSRETTGLLTAERAAVAAARGGDPAGVVRALAPWLGRPETVHRAARLMAELVAITGESPSAGFDPSLMRLIELHRQMLSASPSTPAELLKVAGGSAELFFWDYELARQLEPGTARQLASFLERVDESDNPYISLARAWLAGSAALTKLSVPTARDVGRTLDALAIRAEILLQLDELAAARRIARIVAERAETAGDSWRVGENEILLAQIAISTGDHAAAAHHLDRAAEQAGRFPLPSLFRRRECVAAMLCVRQGRLDDAELLFRKSLAPAPGRQDRIHAAALVNLGFVLDERGRPTEALRCYDSALEFYRARGDTAAVALVRLNRGALWERLNLLDDARRDYEAVLAATAEDPDHSLRVLAQGNLGNIYASRRFWRESVTCYQAALASAIELAEWDRAGQIAGNLAIALLAQGDQEAAEAAWQTAQTMQARQPTPLGRFLLRGVRAHILYERKRWWSAEREFDRLARELQDAGHHALAWEMCYFQGRALAKLSRHEAALACFQKAMTGFENMEQNCGPAVVQLHFLENCDEVVEASIDSLLALANETERPNGIEDEAFRLMEAYRTRVLVREMEGRRRITATTRDEVGLPAIQSWLERRSAFAIALFQGVESVYRLQVGVRFARLDRIASTREFRSAAVTAVREGTAAHIARRRLSRWLFGDRPPPALLTARELFIFPDGASYHLPVELLPVFSSTAGVRPSGEIWPIFYLPGWRFLSLLETASENSSNLVGFLGIHGFPESAAGWSGLPWAEREVRGAADRLLWPRSQVIGGPDWSEGTGKKECLAQGWDVIHVATHIEADETMPWNSRVYLYGAGERAVGMTLTELQAMRWQANLVILSGCSSGRGRFFPGDGNMSLGRALLASGSRAVLLTLWPVLDQSAAVFMDRFYRELPRHSGDVALALRAVRRWMRRDPIYQQPRHWAAFVLFGLPSPVQAAANEPQRMVIGYWIVFFLVALAIGIRLARPAWDRKNGGVV
jgi:tetratricopeptide (TPR) repeat protein